MSNDLISREALKKQLKAKIDLDQDDEFTRGYNIGISACVELIDNAPTVCGNNPKWCESCVSKGKCASTKSQGDLISREALKEYARKVMCEKDFITKIHLELFENIIDNASTVESERPRGEWVGNAFDEHHCNRCGHPALWEEEPDDYYEVQSRFCPNCGADMQKGDTE